MTPLWVRVFCRHVIGPPEVYAVLRLVNSTEFPLAL